MDLFLIRHAQSVNNALPREQRVEDPSLTELGFEQAACLGAWIGALQLTRLYTSAFLRTLLTTKPIVEATGLSPTVRPELHELGGCIAGHIEGEMIGRPGLTGAQIREQFPNYEIPADLDGDGWWRSQPYETMAQAEERAAKLLKRTCEEFAHTNERVAYVTHADFKRVFLKRFHEEELTVPWNTSVTHVTIEPDAITMVSFSQIAHLNPTLCSL